MKNKIIVITGGATGIGFAIANELTADNTVISLDRTPHKISALKEALPKVESIQADVSSTADLTNAIDRIESKYGKIDLLINNAGLGRSFDFVNSSEQELEGNIKTEMEVNYYAPILLTKKALPLLKKSAQPIVAIVSSGLAYMPMSSLGTYCASKVAVHFAAMTLRHQLAALKIRIVEVLPPVVDTNLSKSVTMPKMPANKFAQEFIRRLERGQNVMNVGQSAFLEKLSRFSPSIAFKMLNRR
ncbi:MAG TPA: SDR family NAD(P)-dependent oxidoreductase [Cytophagaceae bacterium]|jgi:uncharacterized oxidoreductase|nr:SDR family NAD(P)-dependent oxidoreductase [Cytophagaceae bacterium]